MVYVRYKGMPVIKTVKRKQLVLTSRPSATSRRSRSST